jgi:proteasome accessory factor B
MAQGLRRRAELVEAGVAGPDGTTQWDRLSVQTRGLDELAEELLGFGDAVVAEAPADLRSIVVGRLDGLLAALGEGAR